MANKSGHIRHIVPHEISEYIKQNYDGGNVVDIKEEKNQHGHTIYKVEVSDDENAYHLEFSVKGNLIKQEVEPIYPHDRHEDFFHEEGFYEEGKEE